MSKRAHQFIRLVDELYRTRGRTMSAFQGLRESQEISELENIVLTAVVNSVRPPTVPQIGRSLGHPRQVIQRAADALVARDLIATRGNPDHKRARLLVTTPAGLTLQEQASKRSIVVADALTRGLDPEMIAETVERLHLIRSTIEKNMREAEEKGEAA